MRVRTFFAIAVGIMLSAAAAVAQSADGAFPGTRIGYETTAALNARLRRLVEDANRKAGAHARAVIQVIGQSQGGEEILAVEIGAAPEVGPCPVNASGPEKRSWGKMPAVLVVGGIAGDRLAGTAVLSAIVERALALGADEFQKTFAKNRLYVIPRVNPDGAARWFARPRRAEGSNRRAIDADRDARADEDPADDLDGDGMILEMRVEDLRGTMIADSDNSRRMRPADTAKGERGRWKVFTEGKDDDHDGDMNEDGDEGVFIEHNFPQGFVENDARNGIYPTSEPETRALLDYVLARKEIAQVIDFGAADDLCDLPEAAKGGEAPAPGPGRRQRNAASAVNAEDREIWVATAKLHKEKTKREVRAAEKEHGSFHQWAYFQFGVPSFAVNLFEVPADAKADAKPDGKAAPQSAPASAPVEDPIQAAERAVRNDGFIAWHAVSGVGDAAVEVGGWKPYVRTNPSELALAALADREFLFLTEILKRAPEVRLGDVRVNRLADGLYEIDAVVENTGALPSALQQGVTNGQTGAVIIDIATPREKILQGQQRTSINRLRENGGHEILRWLVRADPKSAFKITVAPPKAHASVKEVTLP